MPTPGRDSQHEALIPRSVLAKHSAQMSTVSENIAWPGQSMKRYGTANSAVACLGRRRQSMAKHGNHGVIYRLSQYWLGPKVKQSILQNQPFPSPKWKSVSAVEWLKFYSSFVPNFCDEPVEIHLNGRIFILLTRGAFLEDLCACRKRFVQVWS